VELEQIRLDAPTVVEEVVIAHRHTPTNRHVERQFLLGGLFLQVALEQEIALGDVALGWLAQQLRQPVRRQALAGAGDAQHARLQDCTTGDLARCDHALAEVLAVQQFPWLA
jgi:hypothetical protein